MDEHLGAEIVSWRGRLALYTAATPQALLDYVVPLLPTSFDLTFLHLRTPPTAVLTKLLQNLRKSLWSAQLFVSANQQLSPRKCREMLCSAGYEQAEDFPPVVGQRTVVTLWGVPPVVWSRPPPCCKTLMSGMLSRHPGRVLELFPSQGQVGLQALVTGARVTLVTIGSDPELEQHLKEAVCALPRPDPT